MNENYDNEDELRSLTGESTGWKKFIDEFQL